MSTLTLSKRNLSLKTLTFTIGFAAMTAMLGTTACAADPEKTLDDQAAQVEATTSEMQVTPPVETPTEEDETAAPQEEDMMPNNDGETIPADTESDAITAPDTEERVKSDNCFTQADGSVECICVTAESCAELLASETCEAETAWQKDDSYGGCTQKQPE